MLFWIASVTAALLVSITVVAGLLGKKRSGRSQLERNLRVYKRQLQEIDRDLSTGVIADAEAKQSKLEVSRRILRASRDSGANIQPAEAPRRASKVASVLVILALLPGSIAIYLAVGSPGYPDLPLQSRIETSDRLHAERPSQAEYLQILAGLGGTVLPGSTEDGQSADDTIGNDDPPAGLAELRTSLQDAVSQGELEVAVAIQEQINKLSGSQTPTADRIRRAELYIGAARGYVSPEAEAELILALEGDRENVRARYYMGLLALQTGRPDRALTAWIEVLQKTGPTDDIRDVIIANLPAVANLAGVDLQRLRDGGVLPDLSAGAAEPAIPQDENVDE